MQALVKCSAGLDVHRKLIVATIARLRPDDEREVTFETREFSTFRSDLKQLARWLKEAKVELTVMESTGVYWQTVYEVLEDFDVPSIIVNARHAKNVPGRKTDVQDSQWLAQLAMHGLLRASFIPPRDFRELRMLVRYRTKLQGVLAAEKNRLHKVLDSCGIRLGAIVSDIDGVSAHRMIEALIDGKLGLEEIANMAHGHIRASRSEIIQSLDGRISDRHRFLLRQIREHIGSIQEAVSKLDEQVVAAMKPYRKEWSLVQTIPGFDEINAAMLLAEIGTDVGRFGGAGRLSSWAGVCPGNNESAGKKSPDAPVRGIRI